MSKLWEHLTAWGESPVKKGVQNAAEYLCKMGSSIKWQVALLFGDWRIENGVPITWLISALKHENPKFRERAAKYLDLYESDASVSALIEALGDESIRVRYYAADSLKSIGDPAAIPALAEALYGAGSMRTNILGALEKIVKALAPEEILEKLVKWPGVVPALLDTFRRAAVDEEEFKVSELLAKIGAAAVPELIEAYYDPTIEEKITVIWPLAEIKEPSSLPVLVKALHDEGLFAQEIAGDALLEMEPRDVGDLKLLRVSRRKLQLCYDNPAVMMEQKERFGKIHEAWGMILSKRAGEHFSAVKNLPNPKRGKPDSIKRVQLKRVVG